MPPSLSASCEILSFQSEGCTTDELVSYFLQVYFQTLPFLTLLSISEVEAIVRNAEALLELHERIADRIELVEQELRWRDEEEGEGAAVAFKKQWKVRKAAQKIAKVFVNEVSSPHLDNSTEN